MKRVVNKKLLKKHLSTLDRTRFSVESGVSLSLLNKLVSSSFYIEKAPKEETRLKILSALRDKGIKAAMDELFPVIEVAA